MRRMVEIDERECRDLLRGHVFGRVAFEADQGPDIVPVNYALVEDTIHIRTPPDGRLARWADGRHVVFEIDAADADAWVGWSVVVRGRAELVRPRDARRWDHVLPRARSWTGEQGRWLLRISCDTVTGRRLGGSPLPPDGASAR